MALRIRRIPDDVLELFGLCCKALDNQALDRMPPTVLQGLEQAALDALVHIPAAHLFDATPISNTMRKGALQNALVSRNPRVLGAVLARIQRACACGDMLPPTLPIKLHQMPSEEAAVTALEDARLFGITIPHGLQMEALQYALVHDWHHLARTLEDHPPGAPFTQCASWAETVHGLWQTAEPHRIRLLNFLVRATQSDAAALEEAVRGAALAKTHLPMALLLRTIPEASTVVGQVYAQLPPPGTKLHEPNALTLAFMQRMGSAHGRLVVHAWDWSPEALLITPVEPAGRQARTFLDLPTWRDAREARKHARQRARGRTPGPRGGDPSRHPS